MILHHKAQHFLEDLEPISDRIMRAKVRGSPPTSFVNVYAPHLGKPDELKDAFYDTLTATVRTLDKSGPYFVLGDLNARAQQPHTRAERKIIGPYSFGKGTPITWTQDEAVADNRHRFINWCENTKW